MIGADHALVITNVAFAPPLDLAASLAPLGRAGDDLIDRFDGTRALRTLRLASTDDLVAYAAEVTGGADRPALALHVSADQADLLPGLTSAVQATFLADRAALAELAATDEPVARLWRRYPGIVPVLYRDPFTALIRSISAQQVNLRWAATIRSRLAKRYGTRHELGAWEVWTLNPEPLAGAQLGDLRALQLTTAKAQSVIAVARAAQAGALRFSDLDALDDEDLVAHLTGLRGIGRWSAEWFLARTLGRPRVVAGDLGVRKAVGRLYDMPMPTEDDVRRATAHWGAAATHAQALALHDLAQP
ncbi:MAG: DNA-3-methyladenine glycosylase [Chloroflexota bacterium]|nr:DNA-3-methyladenine glycosylase [Chloroflexota bacterium]